MAEAIAGIRFDMTANSAELDAALGRASRSMRQAQQAGQAAGAAIAAAFTRIGGILAGAFAVERLVEFGTRALQTAAAIGRFADQAGLTTEQFQRLDFALRDARVPQEQLSQAFAIFSRNLSDLQRNTGGFLSFLQDAAPGLVSVFRNTRDVNSAFLALTDAAATLRDGHDRVRLVQAAMGEQGARLVNVMRQGSQAMHEQAASAHVLSDAQIQSATEIQRRWDDAVRAITFAAQRMGVAIAEALRIIEIPRLQQLQQEVARTRAAFEVAEFDFQMMRRSRQEDEATIRRVTEAWQAYTRALQALSPVTATLGPQIRAIALAVAQGGTGWDLETQRIRGLNAQMQLFMAQMQTAPNAAIEASRAFQQAWTHTTAVLEANNATQAERDLARLNLMRQVDGEQQRILAGTLTAEEELQRRRTELHHAHTQEIISEAQLNRALQIAEMQRVSAMVGAIGTGLQAMASAWPKQKAFAVAATTASTIQAVMKAWSEPSLPWPLNAAVAGMIAAAGARNIATLMSTNPGSSPAIPSVGGGTAPDAGAGQAPQLLQINLHGDRDFSPGSVADLLEQVGQHFSDGGSQNVLKVIRGM